MTGETIWIGLREGEAPPARPTGERSAERVLAPTQRTQRVGLDANPELALPSHDAPVDRVFMSVEPGLASALDVYLAVAEEVCGRAADGGPRLVVALPDEVPPTLRARFVEICGEAETESDVPPAGTPEERPGDRRSGPAEPAGVDFVRLVDATSVWAQDALEVFEAPARIDSPAPTALVWQTPRERVFDVQALARRQGYPLVGQLAAAGGDDRGGVGGNLESLPDGRLLVGDSAPGSLQGWVSAKGGLVLPSDWLLVGHIDEWLSVRPDGAVIHVDPMRGLEAMAGASEADWAALRDGLDEALVHLLATYGPERMVFRLFARTRLFQQLTTEQFEESLRYYLRDPEQAPPYEPEDFELEREPRGESPSNVSDFAEPPPYTEAELRWMSDFLVRSNILAARELAPGVEALRDAGVELVPTAELYLVPAVRGRLRGRAALPSPINAVWLDGAVVTADPFFPPFREAFRRAAGGARVRFVDATSTWGLHGGVHCMVQVARRAPCEPASDRDQLIFDHGTQRCRCVAAEPVPAMPLGEPATLRVHNGGARPIRVELGDAPVELEPRATSDELEGRLNQVVRVFDAESETLLHAGPIPFPASRLFVSGCEARVEEASEGPGCEAAPSCAECNSVEYAGCGWCPGTGCQEDTESAACETGWEGNPAACLDCEGYADCASCAFDPFCGWCPGTGCISERSDAAASCDGFQPLACEG